MAGLFVPEQTFARRTAQAIAQSDARSTRAALMGFRHRAVVYFVLPEIRSL